MEEANGKTGHKNSIKEPNDENGFNNMQDMEMVGDYEEEDDIQPDYKQEENLDPSENFGSSAPEKAGSSSRLEKPVNMPSESGTQYSPSSSVAPTIRPIQNIIKGKKSSQLRESKSFSRTQINSQLSRIEEDPSEHISENEISKWKIDQQHE